VIAVPRGHILRHRWDAFVDASAPEAWWFHRSEWLDYSLAYTPNAVDRSVAFLDDFSQCCGICPIIDEGGRVGMGGDPCVGPVWLAETDDIVESLGDNLPESFAWRWTHPTENANRTIHLLEQVPGVYRTEWSTVVQRLRGRSYDDRWQDIRKSYRAVIRRAEAQYRIGVGGVERWGQYVQCHQAAATRPRPQATYDHQWAMVKGGHGRIAVAVDGAGSCVAAVLALVYQGRAYYASGPSCRRGVQHGVLWAMSKHLADEGVKAFEIGWTGQPEGSADIEFFKRGFGRERERVVVLSRGESATEKANTEASCGGDSGPTRKHPATGKESGSY